MSHACNILPANNASVPSGPNMDNRAKGKLSARDPPFDSSIYLDMHTCAQKMFVMYRPTRSRYNKAHYSHAVLEIHTTNPACPYQNQLKFVHAKASLSNLTNKHANLSFLY